MERYSKTLRAAAAFGLCLSGALSLPMLASGDSLKIAKGTAVVSPAGELKWGDMPGLAGAKQAPLWGDPTKGEHGILYRWAAGTDVPVHTHTNGDRGVVLSGTMTLAVEGAAPKELPSGSYFSLAGGVKHATTCRPGADCIFFIYREGPFDANMVDIPAKKK